jgi:Fe-S-cluster containining protein
MSIFSPLPTVDKITLDTSVEKIRRLYVRMGKAYDRSASCYDFSCTGCEENCCEERFYHHTLSEFFYLLQGLQTLDEGKRDEIFSRAREVAELYRMHDREEQARRVMCPLNSDGLCSLYEYRPMICRLHGVPYRMRRPDGTETQGTGCHRLDWDMSAEKSAKCMFDRTDLYRELSGIEIKLRQKLGFGQRIKMTIAEMIVEIAELQKAS